MGRVEELKAALEVAELEEKFADAKAKHRKGDLSDKKYQEAKVKYVAARSAAREGRG